MGNWMGNPGIHERNLAVTTHKWRLRMILTRCTATQVDKRANNAKYPRRAKDRNLQRVVRSPED